MTTTFLVQEDGDHLLTEGAADLLVRAQRTYLLKEDHDKLTKEDTGGIFLEHEALQCEDDNEIALELTDGGPLLLESSDEEELYTPRMGFVAVTAGVGHV